VYPEGKRERTRRLPRGPFESKGKIRLNVESNLDDIPVFDDVIAVDDLHQAFFPAVVEIVALQLVVVAGHVTFDESPREIRLDFPGAGEDSSLLDPNV
jgi:hypothetical protein